MTAEFTADIPTESPPYAISEGRGNTLGPGPIVRTAKVLMSEGIALARHRQLEQAITRFTQALSLTISDPAIRLKSYYHRGCALSGMSRYGEAIADFTQVIQFGVSGSSAESSAGSSGAIGSARRFAAVPATKLTELYIHRGNAYRHLGNYRLAAADFESGIKRSGSAQSYGARGLLRLDQDDFDGAIADFSQALKVHPTFAQCLLWRGFARLRHHDYALAIADLSRAVEAIPACAEAYNHRGVAHFYQHDFDKAQADFDQAIRIKPQFAEAYNNRGNLRQLLGEPVSAAADYDRAISLNPQIRELYFNRAAAIAAAEGSAALADNHSPNALAEVAADYDKTAGLSLNSAALYRHRAQVRFQQRRFSAAVADYTSALALFPNAYGYAHRALAYLALGQLKLAQADLDAAIALEPDYGLPYGDRAYLRFKANDLTRAIADTHQAIALANTENPQLKKIYATRCLIHFCLQDRDQALQDFEQLVAIIQQQNHPQT